MKNILLAVLVILPSLNGALASEKEGNLPVTCALTATHKQFNRSQAYTYEMPLKECLDHAAELLNMPHHDGWIFLNPLTHNATVDSYDVEFKKVTIKYNSVEGVTQSQITNPVASMVLTSSRKVFLGKNFNRCWLQGECPELK